MQRLISLIAVVIALGFSGCSLIPEVVHQPVVHNPFPQLTRVAVAPFFNLSTEPGVDGRQFANCYFNELQLIPGFEVVSIGVTEQTIRQYNLEMTSPADARLLAQLLDVDAVVIGAVTDYTPYYPPRCGITVEWYAANACYHPIPAGYGLPWGTPQEEYIPGPLVFEAEMELARAQMKAVATPNHHTPPVPPRPAKLDSPNLMHPADPFAQPLEPVDPAAHTQQANSHAPAQPVPANAAQPAAATQAGSTPAQSHPGAAQASASDVRTASAEQIIEGAGPPENWPDARGFLPAMPCDPPDLNCQPTNLPVMKHTAIYNGNDGEFTAALANYVFFQDDARRGGWQAYLQRSDDFIRFCCRMHLFEMLSARGGAGETRVVWRWPTDR